MQRITFCTLVVCVLLIGTEPNSLSRQVNEPTNRASEVAESINFLKQFHIGMTYDEVQEVLPKTLQQDALAYSPRDNVFLLGIGRSSNDDWSAFLMFDSSDLEIKKPEHLVEINCSSTIPITNESFESVVSRVSGSF